MFLHEVTPARGSTKKRKRIARGNSAGGGTTAGRGTKGQQARTGKGKRFGFEGGQNPLIRRQPKLGGFKSLGKEVYEVLNLDTLETLDSGSYDVASLRAARVLHTKKPVKLLGRGDVKKKFSLTVHAASESAMEAVQKAGGAVTIMRSEPKVSSEQKK